MKNTALTFVCLTIICNLSFSQKEGPAPKIISTIPEFGNCKVDPQIKEIIIKFDQDMSPGMSVIETKHLPQSNGKPQWIDKRTFSIPVKLYPNKLYSLTFNNARFQGFQNVKGVPLNPEDLVFKTSDIPFSDANKQSYKEFIDLFPKTYSYAEFKGIDWETLIEKNKPEFGKAQDPIEFALRLLTILRLANDPHIWIEIEGQRFETGKIRIVNTNYGTTSLISVLKNCKTVNGFSSISGVYDSIGYIAFKNWNVDFSNLKFRAWGNSQNPEISSIDVIKELLAYPNLIIDVRDNMGGNESFAKTFASFFVTDSLPYEKVMNYNEKSGKFDIEYIKKLQPSPNSFGYKGKIYVLSGPSVMSSNESFILMMKSIPNATVIGMKTYGSSGNSKPYTLSNGVTIYLPSWQARTMDGKLIEGNGIDPDIQITTKMEDFQKNDILFEKVVNLIKEKNDISELMK